MRNSILVALNTLKITFRKKSNFIVFIVIPIISVLISLTLYSNSGSSNIRLGINDKEGSTLSKDLIKKLKESGNFKITDIGNNNVNSSVMNEKVDCVLVIPSDFSKSIYNKSFKELQLISIKGEDTTIWIKNSLEIYIQNLLDISTVSKGNIENFNKIYNDYKNNGVSIEKASVKDEFKSKSVTLQSLGFLVMFMMLGATTTSNLILKEKRNRTYYRVLSSPVNSKTYLLGNMMANLFIMVVQVSAVVFFAVKIFKVETYVPSLELILILLCFGLVAIGLGILIVAFSQDTSQASGLSTLIITPTCMLGGCFWNTSLMPAAVQKVSNFMPQKWTLTAITKLQAGSSLSEVWVNIAIIIAFACTFFLIGIYKLRVSNEIKNFI
jgi:ABC-2 type transport system permease protein